MKGYTTAGVIPFMQPFLYKTQVTINEKCFGILERKQCMAKINGEEVTNAAGKTIMEYLTEAGYDSRKVAVERNGSIVPKKSYEEVMITEADTIEIVSFVGGG